MTAICLRNSSSFGDPGIRGDSSSGLCHLSRDPVVSNPRTSLELLCSSLFPALSSPVRFDCGAFCKAVASSGDLVHTAGGTRLAILLGPASDDPQNWIGFGRICDRELADCVIMAWKTLSWLKPCCWRCRCFVKPWPAPRGHRLRLRSEL